MTDRETLCCCIGTGVSLRVLSQSNNQSDLGVSTRCPVGCAEGSCVMDASAGGYKCIKCINSLVVNEVNGRCSCPAGRYATDDGRTDCQDCKKGSYCLGGSFTPDTAPGKAECGSGLTTAGMRSVSLKSCGESAKALQHAMLYTAAVALS